MGLWALRNRIVPGIATLEKVDPELASFPVSSTHRMPRSNVAIVLCRGFAGMNAVIVVSA
jgi:3-oxoacyl-(acyl-carrier-protein) synthase